MAQDIEGLLKTIRAHIDRKPEFEAYQDYFDTLRLLGDKDNATVLDSSGKVLTELYPNKAKAYKHNLWLRTETAKQVMQNKDPELIAKFYELNKKTYLYMAPDDFHSYLIYIEWNRPVDRRFYQPRMHYLRPMVRGYQDILDGKLDLLTISQPKRTGKALTLDTKLLTPTGFIRMGDVRIGTVLIGADGKPTNVTEIYPQGTTDVYDVMFFDGEVIRTSAEHLWTVQTEDDREKGTSRIMSTVEMMNGTMKRSGDKHNNYSIEYMRPAEFSGGRELLLHPYLMGALIGDGSFISGIRITNFDDAVLEKIKAILPKGDVMREYKHGTYGIVKAEHQYSERGYPVKGGVMSALSEYGLLDKNCYEKEIPADYLWASVENRIELLRGLMDTDGCCDNTGSEFSTVSERLSNQVAFLVRSLGGRCSISRRDGKYSKDGRVISTRENFRLRITFPVGINPFYTPIKSEKWNMKKCQFRHFINEIRPAGKAETQCICVDNDDKLFVVGDYFIPTHNSQTGINFVNMLSGRNPLGSTLMEGAGSALVNSFYKGCLELLDPKNTEYLHYDVFPDAPIVGGSAELKTINLKTNSRFPTIMCRSIDATQVGLSEATNLLYLDDLVESREEAKNRDRLDEKWERLSGDVLGRRIEGTPIVAAGTRYSLYDPIGRLQEYADKLGWRWRAIEIPALDPVTDESNYEHVKDGKKIFTTAYLRNERLLLSEEQWESEFQQQPFEAKGLMFPEAKLNRYFELPVDRDPDAIIAVCDTAESGADSVMLPIAYIYGEDVFIEDCVFDNSPPDITKPQCAKKLVQHKVSTATFESNNAGTYYARDVEELVKKLGGRCSIRTKRTISNKHTRIENASDGIIKHFYFKDKSLYKGTDQYGMMMRELITYTRSGKVKHDDAPDGLSLLENEIRNLHGNRVEIGKRPW
jgi:predicted phage terminase large subunit-like protein